MAIDGAMMVILLLVDWCNLAKPAFKCVHAGGDLEASINRQPFTSGITIVTNGLKLDYYYYMVVIIIFIGVIGDGLNDKR